MAKKERNFNKIVGFEIAENNIVAVEIQFTKNSINISGGFKLNLPVFQNVNHTVELIKQSLKAANIKTKDCAFGLSMQYFKMSPVTIPKTIPESEIASIVVQESNIDLGADCISHIPLYSTQRQDADGVFRFDVLGISMSRSLLEISSHISSKCGLNLVSLSPSFLGLGSYLDSRGGNSLVATLWVSQIRSELTVWLGKEPIYEHLFLTHQLNEQVSQSITYLQSQLPGAQISTMYLSGPFLRETNLNQLPYNLQFFSLPPNFLDTGKVLQNITLPELVSPLGVALSASKNLPYLIPNMLDSAFGKGGSKGAFSSKPDFAKLANKGSLGDPDFMKFVIPSVLILLITILAQFYITGVLIPSIQSDNTISGNKISIAESQLKKVSVFDKNNKVLTLKTDYFSELVEKRKPWSSILKEVGDMTPKGLWIDRLEIRNSVIDIFGRALSVDSVANFSINLNYTAKLLGKSQIIAMRKFQEEGFDIVEFQLSAKVLDPVIKEDPKITEEQSMTAISPKI